MSRRAAVPLVLLLAATPPAAQAARAARAVAEEATVPAEPTVTLAPFSAHYSAEWKTLTVGVSDLDLRPGTAPDTYVYTWRITARGIFRLVYSNDVIQKSGFSIEGEHVRPEKYHAENGDSAVDLDFDWESGRVRGKSEKKPVDLQLPVGTQDVMSIQMEVLLDLEHGKLPATFQIVDKDAIKEFIYTLEGPARLRSALGELDTVVVSSQRAGGNRVLKMWFAPSLGYLPVQAERLRDGKLEFAIRIKSLKR